MSNAAPLAEAPPPLTPAALATRAAIVDTAERLFRTLGYQKTTVADIARELRMSPANIYRFFASKGAINEAIAERLLDQILAGIRAVTDSAASPPDRLRALFGLLQEQTMALFFDERRMHDMVRVAMDEHWAVIERYKDGVDQAILKIIRDGTEAGVFGGLPPERAMRMVHAACVVFGHPTLVEQCQHTHDLRAQAQEMAEFCLRALRPD